ncbi:hypothetical protein ABZT51_44080 [Streptomyces sp. NPDC005373]|uniref:hypothetical protein n=1 Tax=Streptomyces sp. NPDC005373 TaxID=3156879 RepID=UPI0033BDB895
MPMDEALVSTGPDGPAAEHVYDPHPHKPGPAVPSRMSLNDTVASVSSAVAAIATLGAA